MGITRTETEKKLVRIKYLKTCWKKLTWKSVKETNL